MSGAQNPRLGTVGGQAVLDGVMMKADSRCAVSVRCPDGSIQTQIVLFRPLSKRYTVLGLPIIRGSVNFFQMLVLGQRVLSVSAKLTDPEQTSSPILERLLSVAAWVFSIALSVGLFLLLPASAVKLGVRWLPLKSVWLRNIAEGFVRIAVLLVYLLLTSLIPDMRRTFAYHGAEHQSVACYEAGDPLTPENAARYTRFHPRCGTSFLFMMIFVGILFYSLPIFSWNSVWERVLMKLLFFPAIAGVGYEIIRFSGKHPSHPLLIIPTAPGLWLQRITTREPSLEQLEVAISALRNSLEIDEGGPYGT